MKKLLFIALVVLISSCAPSNQIGDPKRPKEANKFEKERNRALRSQYGH